MNKIGKIFRLIPILVIGLSVNYLFIKDADSNILFGGAFLAGLLIVFLVALMWANIRDTKEYKDTKSKLSFIPTVLGLILILSFICTEFFLKSRDNSPIIISAGDTYGYWFEFREDGTYKFSNIGRLRANYFRGTYTINDSIITLDKSNIDNVVKGKKLIILTTPHAYTTKKMLYQINDKKEIVNKEFVLTLEIDNRKKVSRLRH